MHDTNMKFVQFNFCHPAGDAATVYRQIEAFVGVINPLARATVLDHSGEP